MFSYEQRHKSLKSDYQKIRQEAEANLSRSPLHSRRTRTFGETLPIVTFISRSKTLNRVILNERHILRYLYWNYDIMLRVTDFSENVDAVADLLSETDVLIGVHQPEWMQAIFLQPGAVTLQLIPFGWKAEGGNLLRGDDVKNIVHLRRGIHLDWVNPHAEFSFFRRKDFKTGTFLMHPSVAEKNQWSKPDPDSPHPAWLYANTYADMNHLKAYIDVAMEAAGIPKLPGWKIAELKAIRQQVKEQMSEQLQDEWVDGNLFSSEWKEEISAEEDDVEDDDEEEEEEIADQEEDVEEEQIQDDKEYVDE